ncbi:MAG: glycoside hydrolase family 32 protein [Oscillospiraceae bacterium]|jgi:sucrose-6-phosphate hydrolase SacC (GH32 family)|nr:glycoside hydrolase family 32 protein [Oscillospiraceae bacterium]
MIRKDIPIEYPYLHVPFKPGPGKRWHLQLWLGGTLLREVYASITAEPDAPYYFLNVRPFVGKTLTLAVPESDGLRENTLDGVIGGGEPERETALYPDLYNEELRPQYHFSSKRGWLNDPNGLAYHRGQFHMYYQHNPAGTPHGGVNICWGHAVSPDLLNWTELDDAIAPWRRDWEIASGSAIEDFEGRAGYGPGALLCAFTALGTFNEIPGREYASGGQFMAASVDGGNTFHLFSTQATVPTENGAGWRDPRLFRFGDGYRMAVYETFKGRNCVSFYASDDLRHWERTSRNMDLYECPDVFPLTDGSGETRWVFYGADGKARIGGFDGRVFTESGESNLLDYGKATYAGQTWSHHPQGKRVHISWVISMDGWTAEESFPDTPFSQCMSIPCELTLDCLDGRYRALRNPIEEVFSLRTGDGEALSVDAAGGTDIAIVPQSDMELVWDGGDGGTLTIHAGTHAIQYTPRERTLAFDNGEKALLRDSRLRLRVLVDTTTMELFFGEGVAATYTMHPNARRLAFDGGGRITGRRWAVRSVWPGSPER